MVWARAAETSFLIFPAPGTSNLACYTALQLCLLTKPLVKMLAWQVRPLSPRKRSYSTAGTMLAGIYLAIRPGISATTWPPAVTDFQLTWSESGHKLTMMALPRDSGYNTDIAVTMIYDVKFMIYVYEAATPLLWNAGLASWFPRSI